LGIWAGDLLVLVFLGLWLSEGHILRKDWKLIGGHRRGAGPRLFIHGYFGRQ